MVDYIDASHEGMHNVLVDNGFTFEVNVNRWAEERAFWGFVYKSEKFDLALYIPKGAIYVFAKSVSTGQPNNLNMKKFSDVAAYFVGKDYENPVVDFISQAHREMHHVLLNVGFTLDCNDTKTTFVDFNNNVRSYDFLYKNDKLNTLIFFERDSGLISVSYTAFNYDDEDINSWSFSKVAAHYNSLLSHRKSSIQHNSEYQIMHDTLLRHGFTYNVTAWGKKVDFEYSKNGLTLGFANDKEFCVKEDNGKVGSEEWGKHFCIYRCKSFTEITQLLNSSVNNDSGFNLLNQACKDFHYFLIANGFVFGRSSFYGFSFGYKNHESKVEIHFDKEDCINSYKLFSEGYKSTTIQEVMDFLSNKQDSLIKEKHITKITPELLINNGWAQCGRSWDESCSWFFDGCSMRLPYKNRWSESESYIVSLPFDRSIDGSGGASTASVDYVLTYLKDNGLELYTDIKFINSEHRKMHNMLLKNGFEFWKNASWDYLSAPFGYENRQTGVIIFLGRYNNGKVEARQKFAPTYPIKPVNLSKYKYAYHFLNERTFNEVTEYFAQQLATTTGELVAC
jgi:hypothetical protein